MLTKLLPILIFIIYFIYAYSNIIPKTLKIPIFLIIHINFLIYNQVFCNKGCINSITMYEFLIVITTMKILYIRSFFDIRVLKRFLLYLLIYIFIILFVKISGFKQEKFFSEIISIFFIVIISYIDFYSFKFNSIKETLKNLSINFYGFLITTSLLFGFKFYLLLSDIKTPSFYYLFLTIPISGAVVYFYTKDLAPILKEAKNKQK